MGGVKTVSGLVSGRFGCNMGAAQPAEMAVIGYRFLASWTFHGTLTLSPVDFTISVSRLDSKMLSPRQLNYIQECGKVRWYITRPEPVYMGIPEACGTAGLHAAGLTAIRGTI
jgi:hypothetical protein